MANDSVADEPCAHQSPLRDRPGSIHDFLVISKGKNLDLHHTHCEKPNLGCLLAGDSPKPEEINSREAYEDLGQISKGTGAVLSHSDVSHDNKGHETSDQQAKWWT